MARNEHSPESFEVIAAELESGAETLKLIAKTMRDSGLPHALIHGSASKNVYLPSLLDWIEKANAEVKMQVRAYLAGVESSAELQKKRSASQKLAAAKKSTKKKTT